MIHIATVHWQKDDWIELQRCMFRKHIHSPYKVYAYLSGISAKWHASFDHVIDSAEADHARKLNALAQVILCESSDEDWLIFIDGDAFPIASLVSGLQPLLAHAPLVAIQRLENLGEKHAHPSFCATTIGFWKQIQGDWSRGYHWINAMNIEETDVGGELLRQLTVHNIQWTPLHRTNRTNILPVWYGIYGDLIYHHGAGFRDRGCRRVWFEAGLYSIYKRIDARIINNIVPSRSLKKVRDSQMHPEGRLKRKLNQQLNKTEQEIRKKIFQDPDFIQSLR
jgi:hypothetical protein